MKSPQGNDALATSSLSLSVTVPRGFPPGKIFKDFIQRGSPLGMVTSPFFVFHTKGCKKIEKKNTKKEHNSLVLMKMQEKKNLGAKKLKTRLGREQG